MSSVEGQDTEVGVEAFERDGADLQYLQFGKAHLRVKIFDLGGRWIKLYIYL